MGFLFLILYPAASSAASPLSHTTLSQTIFHTPSLSTIIFHTQLCHTPSFTHHLCQPPSFTHNFVTHHLSHTTLSHTIFHTHTHIHTSLSTTIFHTPSFTHTIFPTHLCQPPSSTLHGRRGTWSHTPSSCVASVALLALGWLWWRAWSPLVTGDAAPLCVAGVALGDIHLRFTFHVAGVALMAPGWLWWRAWSPFGRR